MSWPWSQKELTYLITNVLSTVECIYVFWKNYCLDLDKVPACSKRRIRCYKFGRMFGPRCVNGKWQCCAHGRKNYCKQPKPNSRFPTYLILAIHCVFSKSIWDSLKISCLLFTTSPKNGQKWPQMTSNQKIIEKRPQLKFNFTY